MPEDLEDKITDFGLMLEGVFAASEVPTENEKTRVLEYWYALSSEIKGNKGEN